MTRTHLSEIQSRVLLEGSATPRASVPTGLPNLDFITGIGGIPRGQMTEVYGKESVGKGTLALQLCAATQKMLGAPVIYIDMEYAFDEGLALAIGVDTSKEMLFLYQPETGVEAAQIVEAHCEDNEIQAAVIVLDSLAAMRPPSEEEGDIADPQRLASHASWLNPIIARLAVKVMKSDIALIFINQTRVNISTWGPTTVTTPGGSALKFWAALRIEMKHAERLKEKDTVYGQRVALKILKNKNGPPLGTTEADLIIRPASGFDTVGALASALQLQGRLERKGPYYYLDGESLGQGKEEAFGTLSERFDELYRQIREALSASRVGDSQEH